MKTDLKLIPMSIKGYEESGYDINQQGMIFNKDGSSVGASYDGKKQYILLKKYGSSEYTKEYIADLMMATFNPLPPDKNPKDYCIIYKDNNPINCNLKNLAWGTLTDRHLTNGHRITLCKNGHSLVYEDISAAVKYLSSQINTCGKCISASNIRTSLINTISGKYKTYHGYEAYYTKDEDKSLTITEQSLDFCLPEPRVTNKAPYLIDIYNVNTKKCIGRNIKSIDAAVKFLKAFDLRLSEKRRNVLWQGLYCTISMTSGTLTAYGYTLMKRWDDSTMSCPPSDSPEILKERLKAEKMGINYNDLGKWREDASAEEEGMPQGKPDKICGKPAVQEPAKEEAVYYERCYASPADEISGPLYRSILDAAVDINEREHLSGKGGDQTDGLTETIRKIKDGMNTAEIVYGFRWKSITI